MKILVILVACVVASLAYPIPEPFEWDETFRVYYEKLDEQHRRLFNIIDDVKFQPSDAIALSYLEDLFYKHFRYEEKMMEDVSYANLATHKRMHTDFESEIKQIHTPVQKHQIDFMKDWLVNHIKGIDFQYKGKLQS